MGTFLLILNGTIHNKCFRFHDSFLRTAQVLAHTCKVKITVRTPKLGTYSSEEPQKWCNKTFVPLNTKQEGIGKLRHLIILATSADYLTPEELTVWAPNHYVPCMKVRPQAEEEVDAGMDASTEV